MNVTSLKDILKNLALSLQISTSFPALALVVFNVFYVFPKLWPAMDWELGNESLAFLTSVSVVMLSYTLSVRSFSGRIGRMIREPGVDACRKA